MHKSSLIIVLGSQWTPQITGSAFWISLQHYWQISDGFLRGQSWRVLKSWYTSRDPEQGFWRFFSDELNRSLVSSVTRAVQLKRSSDLKNSSKLNGDHPRDRTEEGSNWFCYLTNRWFSQWRHLIVKSKYRGFTNSYLH